MPAKLIECAQTYVRNKFENEYSGHDYFHTLRVFKMASRIAECEGANLEIVQLAALLHDVDDRKISPETYESQGNAREFLLSNGVDENTVELVCRTARKRIPELEGFHFHALRHTYTSNLLSNGAAPKDVQELLGHSDVSTTMNVYAHATREAKRNSAKLLDKVVGIE